MAILANPYFSFFIDQCAMHGQPQVFDFVRSQSLEEPSHILQNAQVTSNKNGTQEKTQLSGTVFHTLSHGVLRFVASVSFKNHWIEASDWLSKNFRQPEGGFLS